MQRTTLTVVSPETSDARKDHHGAQVIALEPARLMRALARLGDFEQRVIVWRFGLFDQPEMSLRQIAARLKMPTGAVRTIERDALEAMRHAFDVTEVAA